MASPSLILILSRACQFAALTLLLPAAVGFYYGEAAWEQYATTSAAALLAGFGLHFAGGKRGLAGRQITRREGFFGVVMAWLVLISFGAIPFWTSGSIPAFTDAFFESASGFSTTGATILTDIESIPRAHLFQRALAQWVGGMGIVVLSVAILPELAVGGMQLFAAEASGIATDKLSPRIVSTARRLWQVYVGMTATLVALLMLGGLSGFDAITHAFTTVATGGFSTRNASIGAFDSIYIEVITTTFMLMSGIAKLASGDATWHDLTALGYHFETQPLPTPLAYFAHQLPEMALKGGVLLTFFVELVLPFLLFAPRRPRIAAATIMIVFEVVIFVTGNYNFFNLLTIVLCVAAFDDRCFKRTTTPTSEPGRIRIWSGALLAVFALLGAMQVQSLLASAPPSAFERIVRETTAPWLLVNGYGLFAVMTTRRDELTIEGSMDGEEWREYVFRYKPQVLDRAPPWVAPHQPRLDWQMWFAALGPPEASPWLDELLYGLLEARSPVLALFEAEPFEGRAPTWVRVLRHRYRFTAPGMDAWWEREPGTVWLGPARLRKPVITHEPLRLP